MLYTILYLYICVILYNLYTILYMLYTILYLYIYIKYHNCLCGSVAKASDTQAVGHGFDPRPDH